MAKAIRFVGVMAALALAAASPLAPRAAAAPAHPSVLVVGDSLEELTSPYLPKYLPGVKLTVNAVGGSNSYEIRELFEESYEPSQQVIVFDAGTNDDPAYPQILAGNLARVAAEVGDRCMVVPTIHGLTVNGIDSAGKNRTVAAFAASRPGTQTPDWARFEETHPQLMQADDLHPIPAGAEERARLVAEGVEACLGEARRQEEAREPILASAPERIEPVHELQRRQTELLRAVVTTALPQALALALWPGR